MAIAMNPAAETVYCMDTSSLLAIQQTYPPSVFQDLWEHLSAMARRGCVVAPREVLNELRWVGDESLFGWANENRTMFVVPDSDQLLVVREIVNNHDFVGLLDVDAELPDADPFVAALAIVQQRRNADLPVRAEWVVVVDVDGAHPRHTPKLPDVCHHPSYGVKTIMASEMLREQNLRLPAPQRGLASLYGLWQGVDISETDIEDVKFAGKER